MPLFGLDANMAFKWPRIDAERKRYRELLNEQYSKEPHPYKGTDGKTYGQRTRKLGDHMWKQDRDAFEWSFEQWKEEGSPDILS